MVPQFILNASIAGSKGLPTYSVYSAKKASVRSFARTWTTDLKDRRICVNAISPGSINTPAATGLLASSEVGEQRKKMIPTMVRSAGSGHPKRSPGPSCSARPKTAATSLERNCLWMVASHKCRPIKPKRSLLPNSDGERYENNHVRRGGLTLCETARSHTASNKSADFKQLCGYASE